MKLSLDSSAELTGFPAWHHIPAAGKTPRQKNGGAQESFSYDPPSTPPNERRFRQSAIVPGASVRHFGRAFDPVHAELTHGVKTSSKPGDTVQEALRTLPPSDILCWNQERKERIYASNQREPLGHSYVRGHKLPPGLGVTQPFGVPVHAQALSKAGQVAQSFAAAGNNCPQDPADPCHSMYITSHEAYGAGEQKDRHYNWASPHIDPTGHVFGLPRDGQDEREVYRLLAPDNRPDAQHVKVMSARQADYALANQQMLGTCKCLGVGPKNPLQDPVFGKPPRPYKEEEHVAGVFKGRQPLDQLQPSPDLGKSMHEGWRNQAPPERVFGLPGVRADLPRPAQKSIASICNYGDDPSVPQLLHPTSAAERGVSEQDYLVPRSKETLRQFMTEASIDLDENQFERIFSAASLASSQPPLASRAGLCSVDAFLKERHHLLRRDAGLA